MPGENTIKLFAEYGGFIGLLVGVMLLGMATAIVFQWRHIIALHKQVQAVQDKRVEEAKEVRKELMGLAGDFNKAVHELGSLITSLKDAVLLRERDR